MKRKARSIPDDSHTKGLEFAKAALIKAGNFSAAMEIEIYLRKIKGSQQPSVRQMLRVGRENSGYTLARVSEATGMKICKIFNAESADGAYLRFDEMVALADLYSVDLADLAFAVRYHEKTTS